MSGAIGKRQDAAFLDLAFGGSGTVYVSLHTGNPGNDGQAGNEATGSGYARAPVTSGNWNAATNAEPSVKTNSGSANFPTATGDWSSAANFTWIGLWTTLAGTTEADFVGRLQLSVAKPVLNGDTPSLAASAISASLD